MDINLCGWIEELGGKLLWNANRIMWKTDEDRRRLENFYGWM
jgi:hypothetical protein